MAQLPFQTSGSYCEPKNQSNQVYRSAVHFLIDYRIKQRWFQGCGPVIIENMNNIECNEATGRVCSTYVNFWWV